MSLTSKGKSGRLIRKQLALSLIAKQIATPKPIEEDSRNSGPDPVETVGKKQVSGTKADVKVAKEKDTKFSVEGRRRFGYVSGSNQVQSRTINQNGAAQRAATKETRLESTAFMSQGSDKTEEQDTRKSDSSSTEFGEESRQYISSDADYPSKHEYTIGAANNLLAKTTSVSPESADGQSSRLRGHARKFATDKSDNKQGPPRGKSDKPEAAPSLDTLEEEIGRLKLNLFKTLEDFQALNATALQLEKQVKTIRSDRQKMTS